MNCAACGDKGLIRVEYHEGSPYDVAICRCVKGGFFRDGGEPLVRNWLKLQADHRVGLLEDFDDAQVPVGAVDFESAGAKPKRKAKL